jgi:NADH:ubiquinone oxidoreductase subunit 2 (subunit N)
MFSFLVYSVLFFISYYIVDVIVFADFMSVLFNVGGFYDSQEMMVLSIVALRGLVLPFFKNIWWFLVITWMLLVSLTHPLVIFNNSSTLVLHFIEFSGLVLILYLFMLFVYRVETGWEDEATGFIFQNPAELSSYILLKICVVIFILQGVLYLIPISSALWESNWLKLTSFTDFHAIFSPFQLVFDILVVLNNMIVHFFQSYAVLINSHFGVSYKIMLLRTVLTGFFCFFFWQMGIYCKAQRIYYYEYPFFLMFLLVSCWAALEVETYTMFYMLLELQGLCLIVLISVSHRLTQSIQTGLRYALINIVGSLFILFGIIKAMTSSNLTTIYLKLVQIYPLYVDLSDSSLNFKVCTLTNTGSPLIGATFDQVGHLTDVTRWTQYVTLNNIFLQDVNGVFRIEEVASSFSSPVVPFVFIFLGLCVKLGVGPFSYWIPSVYSGMHVMSLMVFATVPKFIYVYFLTLFYINNNWLFLRSGMSNFFLIMGIFSLIIGSVGLFRERYNLFRFVGWSTIVNFSLVMLAFAIGAGVRVILLFVVYYSISVCFFLAVSNFLNFRQLKEFTKFTDSQYLMRNFELYPLLAVFIGSLFSFFGFTPFVGFWGKLYLLKGMMSKVALFAFSSSLSSAWIPFVKNHSFFLGSSVVVGKWVFIIIIFFVVILVGGMTYLRLFNIVVSEQRWEEQTFFSFKPINMAGSWMLLVGFLQMQLFSFYVLFVFA